MIQQSVLISHCVATDNVTIQLTITPTSKSCTAQDTISAADAVESLINAASFVF